MDFLRSLLDERSIEGELVDRTPVRQVEKLADQFVRAGFERGAEHGYKPDILAKKLAAQFHRELVEEIDRKLAQRRRKHVGASVGGREQPTGREWVA